MIWPDRHHTLGTLLSDALVQYKTDTACILAKRKEIEATLSYRDLARRAGGIAQHLPLSPGDRVAIVLSNAGPIAPPWLRVELWHVLRVWQQKRDGVVHSAESYPRA